MKYLACLFILISFSCLSQPCDSIINYGKDRFTGKPLPQSKEAITVFDSLGEPLLVIKVAFYKMTAFTWQKIGLFMAVPSDRVGCISTSSTVYFLFNDEFRLNQNSAEINCSGKATVYFEGALKDNITPFVERTLSAIRITSVSQYIDIDIPEKQALELQRHIECIVNN